jgi:hypothetical protein
MLIGETSCFSQIINYLTEYSGGAFKTKGNTTDTILGGVAIVVIGCLLDI